MCRSLVRYFIGYLMGLFNLKTHVFTSGKFFSIISLINSLSLLSFLSSYGNPVSGILDYYICYLLPNIISFFVFLLHATIFSQICFLVLLVNVLPLQFCFHSLRFSCSVIIPIVCHSSYFVISSKYLCM